MQPLEAELETSPRTGTTAELARERKLRADPMANVHGPLFVTCKRCGNRIKLSPKSSYDPFHWMKHKERCLRKSVTLVHAVGRTIVIEPDSVDPKYTSPTKQSPASSSNTDGDNVTPPPLTPDDDDRPAASDAFSERSLSPNIDDLALPGKPAVRALDAAFVRLPHHSQRLLPKHVPLIDRWQTWDWSELRSPSWAVDHHYVLSPEEVETSDDPNDSFGP